MPLSRESNTLSRLQLIAAKRTEHHRLIEPANTAILDLNEADRHS